MVNGSINLIEDGLEKAEKSFDKIEDRLVDVFDSIVDGLAIDFRYD